MSDSEAVVPARSNAVNVTAGPLNIHAYHDYSYVPWRSPLYVGFRLYVGEKRLSVGTAVSPESPLRPFSGCGDHNTSPASEVYKHINETEVNDDD